MKISRDDEAFYKGVLAALAVVKIFDAETIFREIVETCNKDKLIAVAKKGEDGERSGLVRYKYIAPSLTEPQPRRPRGIGGATAEFLYLASPDDSTPIPD